MCHTFSTFSFYARASVGYDLSSAKKASKHPDVPIETPPCRRYSEAIDLALYFFFRPVCPSLVPCIYSSSQCLCYLSVGISRLRVNTTIAKAL